MSNSEPNATPDQLPIDDQLIALVRVARALRYDDAAEWISKRAMARIDKALAEVSEPREISCSFCANTRRDAKLMIAGHSAYICDECVRASTEIVAERLVTVKLDAATSDSPSEPRKCVQTVNRFEYPLVSMCNGDERLHTTPEEDCRAREKGCLHHVPLYAPTPASEPSRTDAVRTDAVRKAVALVTRRAAPQSSVAMVPAEQAMLIVSALADAERKLADATWGHCSGHMKLWRELSDLVAEHNSDDDPCVGCAFVDANRYIHELHKAIVDGGPDGDPIAILREQREGAVRESKTAYERIETLMQQLDAAEKRAKDAEADGKAQLNKSIDLALEVVALTRNLATAREGLRKVATGFGGGVPQSDMARAALAAIDAPAGEEAGVAEKLAAGTPPIGYVECLDYEARAQIAEMRKVLGPKCPKCGHWLKAEHQIARHSQPDAEYFSCHQTDCPCLLGVADILANHPLIAAELGLTEANDGK